MQGEHAVGAARVASSAPIDTRRRRSTLVGAVAVALWSLLALLTSAAGPVPPCQLLAMTFGVAALIGLVAVARGAGGGFAAWPQPARVWLLGGGGLFGYHFLYFVALRSAPVADASLVAFLWPVLIVLFSGLLPGERSRWYHVVGVLLGLGGAALLVTRGGSLALDARYLPGYATVLGCALLWSGYSLANRLQGAIPTGLVAGYCAIAALLGLASHLALETTVWPAGGQWLAVLALGAGPMGASFFARDQGTRHGDLPLLGVLSYAAPLLSTLALVAFGHAEPTLLIAGACLLIVAGAMLAAHPVLLPLLARGARNTGGRPAPTAGAEGGHPVRGAGG